MTGGNWSDPLTDRERAVLLGKLKHARDRFGDRITAFSDYYVYTELCYLITDVRQGLRS